MREKENKGLGMTGGNGGGPVLECEVGLSSCRLCPRLTGWREEVGRLKRKAYEHEVYWSKPVPSFGDPGATLLIVGLAPGAHGSNRTGRMFTGDRSGEWLFRALFRAGLANQATYERPDDGLILNGVLITAVARCAPPGNKPERAEIAACERHLLPVLRLRRWNGVLCLGSVAFQEVWRHLGSGRAPLFGHGASAVLSDGSPVLASYHPSQQNTFTGKLTEAMLDAVMGEFASRR